MPAPSLHPLYWGCHSQWFRLCTAQMLLAVWELRFSTELHLLRESNFSYFPQTCPMTEPSVRDSTHLEEGHFFSSSQWQRLGQRGPFTCPT